MTQNGRGASKWEKPKMARRQTETSYLGPFAEFDRVWPAAGLTLALFATVSWMGLLGYVAIKLLLRAAGDFRASAAPDLGSPLGVPHKLLPENFVNLALITYTFHPIWSPVRAAFRLSALLENLLPHH